MAVAKKHPALQREFIKSGAEAAAPAPPPSVVSGAVCRGHSRRKETRRRQPHPRRPPDAELRYRGGFQHFRGAVFEWAGDGVMRRRRNDIKFPPAAVLGY